MLDYNPEQVLPNLGATIVRHESYGSTQSNQTEITRAIKSNFDNGVTLKSFTVVVHASPKDSPQAQELAYLVEYSDNHIELYDQHTMSINRTPRESEIIGLFRTLVHLGAGERIFYCTKRLSTEVFQQSPLMTATVIKSKGIKSLLANWHDFTSVNSESYKTYPRSIFKEKEWDKLSSLVNTSINAVSVLNLPSFYKNLEETDDVIVGYVGRRLKEWVFVVRRQRAAYITFCDKNNIHEAYKNIVGKYNLKCFGDFVKDSILNSSSQQLISVNQEQLINEYDDSSHDWLFRHLQS